MASVVPTEIIIYRGHQIYKFSERSFVAYTLDRYNDLEMTETSSLEGAQGVIDRHIGCC